jgi:hypothetical protein
MQRMVELADRAALDRDVPAAFEAHAGVVAPDDGVAVDRVAGEVERDAVGADDEPVGGAVREVMAQRHAARDRGPARRVVREGGRSRQSGGGERSADHRESERDPCHASPFR